MHFIRKSNLVGISYDEQTEISLIKEMIEFWHNDRQKIGKIYNALIENYGRPTSSNAFTTFDISSDTSVKNAFSYSQTHQSYVDNLEDVSFTFNRIFKQIGIVNVDYTLGTGIVTFLDPTQFTHLRDGDKLCFQSDVDTFVEFTIDGLESSNYASFTFDDATLGVRSVIYQDLSNQPLFVSLVFDYDDGGGYDKYIRLSPFRAETVTVIEWNGSETNIEYLARLEAVLVKNQEYHHTPGLQDVVVNVDPRIDIEWFGAITNFGNKLMEKTMYRANIYATKQEQDNTLLFGYKTMRRIKTLDDTSEVMVSRKVDLASTFNFDAFNFNIFGFNTFNEFGMSFPIKENNFLYIQVMIKGKGQIELNSIEIIYKNNRMLKSIG